MSDTETGSDETTELAAPPQATYAPDLYLVVVSAVAGALLALMGVLLVDGGSATGETPCTHPTEAAAAEAPGQPTGARGPVAPAPAHVRPLEDESERVSLPEPEDDMPWSVPVAAKCTWTRVTDVGSRFADTPPLPDGSNGISVSFKSGLSLISYSSHPAIAATKVGSRVQVCLVQEMRGCPPGDDRGKTYRVYDPLQGIAWSMGEDLHICGGA